MSKPIPSWLLLIPMTSLFFAGIKAAVAVDFSEIQNRGGYTSEVVGDPTSETGARIVVASAKPVELHDFGGVIARLPAAGVRGKQVTVSARAEEDTADGIASVWVRVDGEDGARLTFASSEGRVPPAESALAGEVRTASVQVPAEGAWVVFGAALRGPGRASFSEFTISFIDARAAAGNPLEVATSAMGHIREHALHGSRLDFMALELELQRRSPVWVQNSDAHAFIRGLIEKLEDGHSSFIPVRQARDQQRGAGPTGPLEVRHLGDGVAYLRLPGFVGTANGPAAGAFVHQAIAGIESVFVAGETRGWILDLRHNGGGNIWPMLAAVAPFLGSATIGGFKSRHGAVDWWVIDESWPRVSADVAVALESMPVAVLLGPVTGSSGEGVAIAFVGRGNTRSFGAPTAGLSTANRWFDLPDGSAVNITVAVDVDRHGREYPRGLAPDVPVDESTDDALIDAARLWLMEAGACLVRTGC